MFQIIVIWFKIIIECFIMISFQNINQLLNIFEVSISIFFQPIFMIRVIPTTGNWTLYGNTIMSVFFFETLINLFKFFLGAFKTITCVSFVFGCVWIIFTFLSFKYLLFLFQCQVFKSECFNYSAPFLTYSHLDSF